MASFPIPNKKTLQTVANGVGECVVVLDQELRLKWLNPSAQALMRIGDVAAVVGKNCYEVFYDAKDACENCPVLWSFMEGMPGNSYGKALEFTDGSCSKFDMSSYPVFDADGKVSEVIGCIRDVTRAFELENVLNGNATEAQAARVAACVANEIKAPLVNISQSAMLCLESESVGEDVRSQLRLMLKNSEIASRVLENLMCLAAPEVVRLRPGHVERVVDMACALLSQRLTSQGVWLEKKAARGLPKVMLDEKRLEGALISIMMNSLDAMTDGGRLNISIHAALDGSGVTLLFSDTGAGIPAEDLDMIFEPFYTTKRKGVGVGLTSARKVIVRHNGKVEAKSDENKGTTVTVTLPALGAMGVTL